MNKHLLIFIMSLCFCQVLQAQQTIGYSYDATGNRTGRSPYFLTMMSEEELQAEDFSLNSLDNRRYKVTAAPNPSHGFLQVTILGIDDDATATLTLFDSLGRSMLSTSTSREVTTLDLMNLPSGLYLLRAAIGSETTTIKIIRED